VLHLLGFEDETPSGYREMLGLGHDAVRQKVARLPRPRRLAR
jgi:ssRNA-specific RNase YbeY (16S rRNA maturation enzyme)